MAQWNREEWLSQVDEPVIDPGRVIIDPHHHLWRIDPPYLLADLRRDTEAGHNVVASVFIECGAEYRTGGPEQMRYVGETEFVLEEVRKSEANLGARIAAIVGAANLLQGASVEEVLQAHIEAGQGYFRGIRHAAAWDPSDEIRLSHHNPPPHMYLDRTFREGFAKLAPLGLTFEAWLFHPQIPELTDLARAFPDTPIVLNHFGGPLGIGPYADRKAEVFHDWLRDVSELAGCPNVFAKLGGIAMPINGYDWHEADRPATAGEFIVSQAHYYRAAIDLFGPERCMFESNFPVDRQSISYKVLWNAFKRLARPFTETEKDHLFRGTAARFYRIDTDL